MKTALFDFDLPTERIATHPTSPRDVSRLLVVQKNRFEDRRILNLPDLLQPGDLMVFNDTKVIAAQLKGRRGEANVGITLISYKSEGVWQAFAKPGKRLKTGDILRFNNSFPAKVIHKYENGIVELKWVNNDWRECIDLCGKMPLPSYMKRDPQPADKESYQTVYAQNPGAVAAPTAGLHFTPELLAHLAAKNIEQVKLTLHVGAGTFLPIKTEETENHVMHEESYEISDSVATTINQARKEGRRIIAVGTTALRALESNADSNGILKAASEHTSIFITPGYRFKVVDILLTNFHLPRSTLFMLVCAFSGLDTMKRAYEHAIREHYRFYSYGDACLLYRS